MLKPIDNQEFKKIYKQFMKIDFPAEELKPLGRILRQKKQGIAFTLGYYEEDKLSGYAVIEQDSSEKVILLDYFAIFPECRKQGKGKQFLKEIKLFFQDKEAILIESETAVSQEAVRRLEFYRSAGARLSEVKVNLFHVDYHILVLETNSVHSEDELRIMLNQIYSTIYPLYFRKRFLKYI